MHEAVALGSRAWVGLVNYSEDFTKLGTKTEELVFGPDNLLLVTNLLVLLRSFSYMDSN